MRAALIKKSNNKVENVIIIDNDYEPPKGYYVIESETAAIGDTYDKNESEFVTPPE